MNKKGQTNILISIGTAIVLFMIGMLVVNFFMPMITTARTDNSCSAPLTDGGKALCLVIDWVIPYFFIIVIAASGGVLINRFLQ